MCVCFRVQRLRLRPQSAGSPECRQTEGEDCRPGKRLLGGETPLSSASSSSPVAFWRDPTNHTASFCPLAQTLHWGHPDQTVPSSGGSDRSRVWTARWHLEHRLHGTHTRIHTISSRHVGLTCRWLVWLTGWSVLFQAFELATGDYLFEPHSGEDYTRDEGWLHRTAASHYHSVTWKPSSDVCVCVCFRSHRSHHRAARSDPSALRSVWQILQRVLQPERWDRMSCEALLESMHLGRCSWFFFKLKFMLIDFLLLLVRVLTGLQNSCHALSAPPPHTCPTRLRWAASHLQPEAVGSVRGPAGEVWVAAGPGGSVQRLPADHVGAAARPAGDGSEVSAARLAAHINTLTRCTDRWTHKHTRGNNTLWLRSVRSVEVRCCRKLPPPVSGWIAGWRPRTHQRPRVV